jgi:phosphoadenosine phosphosulfate reductase
MNAITIYGGKPSIDFEEKLAASIALLRDAGQRFQPLTQANSLGIEDIVITHLLAANRIASEVFVLQTGKLHAETLALLETLKASYAAQLTIRVYEPDAQTAAQFVAQNGELAMRDSIELRKACCNIRKMEPLARALTGKRAWITGLRREQSDARAGVSALDLAGSQAKINPLVDWTFADVWHYTKLHELAYNPLHDKFYPSIGCEPCTRSVTLGEDFRSGRWWWESSTKECGLHVAATA